MARQGWVGEKAGTGFYVRRGRRKTVNPGAAALLLGGRPASVMRPEEARDRMVLLMVNEAAACLEEGVVERPELLDLAMVIGTGWAPHRGGPLRYADDRGPAKVVEALEQLAAQRGPRFTPAAELRRRASGAPLFYAGLEAATGR